MSIITSLHEIASWLYIFIQISKRSALQFSRLETSIKMTTYKPLVGNCWKWRTHFISKMYYLEVTILLPCRIKFWGHIFGVRLFLSSDKWPGVLKAYRFFKFILQFCSSVSIWKLLKNNFGSSPINMNCFFKSFLDDLYYYEEEVYLTYILLTLHIFTLYTISNCKWSTADWIRNVEAYWAGFYNLLELKEHISIPSQKWYLYLALILQLIFCFI